MKKELTQYIQLVHAESLDKLNIISSTLIDMAESGTLIDEDSVEYAILDSFGELEDPNAVFDLSQTAEAKKLLKIIIEDLEEISEEAGESAEELRETERQDYINWRNS